MESRDFARSGLLQLALASLAAADEGMRRAGYNVLALYMANLEVRTFTLCRRLMERRPNKYPVYRSNRFAGFLWFALPSISRKEPAISSRFKSSRFRVRHQGLFAMISGQIGRTPDRPRNVLIPARYLPSMYTSKVVTIMRESNSLSVVQYRRYIFCFHNFSGSQLLSSGGNPSLFVHSPGPGDQLPGEAAGAAAAALRQERHHGAPPAHPHDVSGVRGGGGLHPDAPRARAVRRAQQVPAQAAGAGSRGEKHRVIVFSS